MSVGRLMIGPSVRALRVGGATPAQRVHVADCTSSACAVNEPISSEPFTKPTTQEPADCGGGNCATPAHGQRVHVACEGSSCN
jgi:hypothetical protein